VPIIGVRELRERTAEILQAIREEHAEYVVTHQGKPVALLVPASEEAMERAMLDAGRRALRGSWEAYARAADEVRSKWPSDRSSREALDDVRR
jgi:prevent-host-death family protein